MNRLIIILLVIASHQALGWGKTGHRVVGQIAEQNLSKKAAKRVKALLKDESLSICSTWMDDIKSDSTYNHTHDWHWVTVPDGTTYEESEKNPNGNIIQTLNRLIEGIKSGKLNDAQETEYLKMLIHLVGDIHQPLHVGKGYDKGGNDVAVKWFGMQTNLHRVWDSHIIDETQLSYTEFYNALPKPNADQIKTWQNTTIMDWVKESISYRPEVYNTPSNNYLGYEYAYFNLDLVELRIMQAGYRLAGILNEIYG